MAKRFEIVEHVNRPFSRVAEQSVIRGLDWDAVENRLVVAGANESGVARAKRYTDAGCIYSYVNAEQNYCQINVYEA